MKEFVLVFATALSIIACSKKSEEVTIIDPDQALEVRFENVATNVRIVPLQSDEPLGQCNKILCSGNEVLILESDLKTVYYFKDGKHLTTLHSVGRGPGEYTDINNICYDSDRKILYADSYNVSSILQYSVPDMKFIGSLKTPSVSMIESIKLYDDKTLMLSLKDGKEYGCFLYDLESQTIISKVCDLTTYQGENGNLVLDGFNKKNHLISLFHTNNRLLNYTGQEMEEVLKFCYGKKGVDLIYDISLQDPNNVKTYFDYIDTHEDHFKDLRYPNMNDKGVSFWYSTLSNPAKNYHYYRTNGQETVSLKGFTVPGITIPIVPDCITDDGYATIIKDPKDKVIDPQTAPSELGQKIIDALNSQNDDNPILVYFSL